MDVQHHHHAPDAETKDTATPSSKSVYAACKRYEESVCCLLLDQTSILCAARFAKINDNWDRTGSMEDQLNNFVLL